MPLIDSTDIVLNNIVIPNFNFHVFYEGIAGTSMPSGILLYLASILERNIKEVISPNNSLV